MQASAEIILMSWKKNKDGISFVKLRVIHNRKTKYFSITDYVKNDNWATCSSVDEFNKILSTKGNSNRIEIKKCYDEIKEIADGHINEMPVFSFDQFKNRFSMRVKSWDSVSNAFEQHITHLREKERHGYAESFNSTFTAIKYFCEGKKFNRKQPKHHLKFSKFKDLKFADITTDWLERFESYLDKNKKSTSTKGIYARNIRVLFNIAIKEHFVKVSYPFATYRPPESKGNKRALTIQQISQIASYEALDGTHEQMARDMFIFSFLANGMNLTDIYRLRNSNFTNDEFSFVRQKTKGKRKEVRVTVVLTSNLKEIIKRQGKKSLVKSHYVFPLLGDVDEQTNFGLIKQRIRVINNHLKKIARNLKFDSDISDNISTYFARHSWATISTNSGANINFIKESLGHLSTKTTENYLGSLEKENRVNEANKMDSKIKIG